MGGPSTPTPPPPSWLAGKSPPAAGNGGPVGPDPPELRPRGPPLAGPPLRRKAAGDGARRGIKAKPVYPARPRDWPADKDWPADVAFALVGAELLNGKSIGFLPTRVRTPDAGELDQPGWKGVVCV